MVLAREYGCRLQMGGSDQWGNIVNGIELARRIDGAELFGVTSAADHHRRWQEDGQVGLGRGVAQRRAAARVGFLAILAQHRRSRRRPLPATVHRPPARRNRAARSARRGGDQRRQGRARQRRSPRWCAAMRLRARPKRPPRPPLPAERARTCQRSMLEPGMTVGRGAHRARLHRIEWRGQAQDRRGCGAARRGHAERRRGPALRPAASASARSATRCCTPPDRQAPARGLTQNQRFDRITAAPQRTGGPWNRVSRSTAVGNRPAPCGAASGRFPGDRRASRSRRSEAAHRQPVGARLHGRRRGRASSAATA